ncbi:hypothetical protein [Vulcanococcus limneticus]|nr:hypothetical protein [Vulcanococcus limneticus]
MPRSTAYKGTRQSIAARREAHRRRWLEGFDPPLLWLLGWPC